MDRRNRPGSDPDATLIEGAALQPRDVDATLIESHAPPPPLIHPPAPPSTADGSLMEAAAPLLIRVTRLRNTLDHPDPAGLHRQLDSELAAFRQRLAGFDPVTQERAGQLLAVTIDDLLLHDTAWGEAWRQQGLLSGPDGNGSRQLQELLRDCLEAPQGHQTLLELVHVCLALGLRGSYRAHPDQWQVLREQTHRALAPEPVDSASSVEVSSSSRLRTPPWLLPALGSALLLALYGGLAMDLTQRLQDLRNMASTILPATAPPAAEDAGLGWSGPAALLLTGGLGVPLALLGWGGQVALRRWQEQRQGRRLLAELIRLAEACDNPQLGRGLADLAGRIGPAALNRLPWYWVLGESGSGRGSALEAMAGDKAQRIADTGICGGGQWLLTDRAILIDDRGGGRGQGWQQLLECLGRLPGRQPRVTVLTVVAADRLPTPGQPLPYPLVNALEGRLRALQQTCKRPLPVRLLVSRLDRIAGFREFFSHLDARQRSAAWGLETGDLNSGFSQLLARLWRQLPARLWGEEHDSRRQRLFAFPAQFATLAAPLEQLQRSLHSGGTKPAGLYFTSALQQGDTGDRLNGGTGVATQSQLLPLPLQRRSHFLAGLLTALAPRSQPRRGGRLGRWTILATLSLIAALWLAGYGRERLYLEQTAQSLTAVQEVAQTLPGTPDDPLATLPLLEAARQVPGPPADSLARLARLLGPVPDESAIDPYPRLLKAVLAPPLKTLLERELEPRLLDQDPIRGLTALGAYQALSERGGDDAMLEWWRSQPQREDARWRALEPHLTALLALEGYPLVEADRERLAQAQGRLANMDTARRLYAQLRQACVEEVLTDFEPATLDPTGVFTSPRTRLSARGERIPGCFTRGGLLSHLPDRAAIRRLLQSQGALGGTSAVELDRLLEEVQRAYLQDYVARWQDLLANLELSQLTAFDTNDFNRSVRTLERLADPGVSPLVLLLGGVDRHIHVEPSAVRQVDDDPSALMERYLDEAFSGLHWAVRADNLATLRRLLRQLADRLRALIPTDAAEGTPVDPTAREAALGAIRDLERFANYQPQPLNRWLRQLVGDSNHLVIRDQAARLNWLLNEFWLNDVLSPCRQGIEGHYPLTPWGVEEATLEDFGEFFGNDGVLAVFFRQYLAEFVDTDRSPWQWRSGGEYGRPAVSPETLALFERAVVIRQGLFASDALRPQTLFELQTLPESVRAVMTLDDQQVDFGPGYVRPYALQWPAGQPSGVSVRAGSGEALGQWNGPWSWLALLQAAEWTQGDGGWPYRVSLGQGDRQVVFALRSDADHDPFALIQSGVLTGFACPGRL